MAILEDDVDPAIILPAASIVAVTTIVIVSVGCMWCRNKWKRLTRRHYEFSSSDGPNPSDPPALTEFTLFPPPASNQFSLPTGISPDEVVFEPLPEIRSRRLGRTGENVRPARFTASCERISLQDWFDEHQVNFPRDHLAYFREVGATWYGQAVEGEAKGIRRSGDNTRVVVKILRVDATSTELMQFLQETRALRDLKHPNLLKLLDRCLEVHPFLLIMEHCDMDLKSYLIEQRKSPESLLKDGILLRMACNITSALQCMHEYGFIHMDVAAHSCLINSEGIVKVGDYGTAVHVHKGDFYCLGDVAFPIRWCAPETLMCTESVVEAKDITREANIWSFGVVLWELLEFGKLPYVNVSDNEVIQKVLMECFLRLEQPKTPCVHKDMIYKIMQLCWMPPASRPSIQKVSTLLNYLYDNRDVQSETAAFESRWDSLQPAPREHNLQTTLPNVALRFESDFMPRNSDVSADCDSVMSAEFDRGGYGDKSPSSGSISMGELGTDISPSLLNLRGSVEDLIVGGDATIGEGVNGQRRRSSGIGSENGNEVELNGNDSGGLVPQNNNSAGHYSRNESVGHYSGNDSSGGYSDNNNATGGFSENNNAIGGYSENNNFAGLYFENNNSILHYPENNNNSDGYFPENNNSVRHYTENDNSAALGSHNNDSSKSTSKNSNSTELSSQNDTEGTSSHKNNEHKNELVQHYSRQSDSGGHYNGSVDISDETSEPPSLETIPASEASDSETIQMRISEAIRDLDTILADETSSETSDYNSPEKRQEGQNDEARRIANNGASVVLDLEQAVGESSGQLQETSEIRKKSTEGHVNVNILDD